MHTAVSHHESYVAVASGDTDGAATLLSTGYERLEEMGEKALLSTTTAMLADDLSAQVLSRMARARLLAQRGEMPEAKQIAAEAVALAMRTDWLTDQADALLSQAQVLGAAGDGPAAADACRSAIDLYTRKGNEVGARRAHLLLG